MLTSSPNGPKICLVGGKMTDPDSFRSLEFRWNSELIISDRKIRFPSNLFGFCGSFLGDIQSWPDALSSQTQKALIFGTNSSLFKWMHLASASFLPLLFFEIHGLWFCKQSNFTVQIARAWPSGPSCTPPPINTDMPAITWPSGKNYG